MKKGILVSLCLFVILPLTSVENSVFAQAEWNLISQVGGSTQAVAVDGTNLYLGVGWHMEAFDTSDPEEIVFRGNSKVFPDSIENLFIHNSSYLYAVYGSSCLQILDISNPSHPELSGSYEPKKD